MSSPKYLFVYGTLRRKHAPPEITDVVNSLELVSEASVPGNIFDLGEYPGAVFEPNSQSIVHGEVFKLPNNPKILRKLDNYEEFKPENPEKSLFIREVATALTGDGQYLNCWVYRINSQFLKKRTTRKRPVRPVRAASKRAAR
jgi:gamma-glutamylcyclotransferase (GGCT)/AIG2-like uncharacterized protein YtfP